MAKTGFVSEMAPEDVPRAKRGRGMNWERVAAEAKSRPWEPYIASRSISRSVGTRIRQGHYAAFRPPEDWRVACKGTGVKGVLVVMYVGTPPPPGYNDHPIWNNTYGWKEDGE